MSDKEEVKTENGEVTASPEVKPQRLDGVNISTQYLYCEVVWAKDAELVPQPGVVIHHSWIPEPQASELKMTKKRLQNLLFVHLFNEGDPKFLSVGIKDISYPFEAFLEDYAKDGHVSDYNLNNAKDFNQCTRIERYNAYPKSEELELLDMSNCCICSKPIEDLDDIDLQIVDGVTKALQSDESYFQNKSYVQCSNCSCLSLFHKSCDEHSSFPYVCSYCRNSRQREEKKKHRAEEHKRGRRAAHSDSEEERPTPPRRRSRRNDSDEEDRSLARRVTVSTVVRPVRSTRGQTYRMLDSDDEIRERTPKKRKIATVKSTPSTTAKVDEKMQFPRMTEEEVKVVVEEVVKMMYGQVDEKMDEKASVAALKQKLKSPTAVGNE